MQAAFAGRIEGLVVADVMDAEPVAIPETLTLERAEDEFFLRYGWPWFPVVDATGRLWAWCRGRPWTAWPSRCAARGPWPRSWPATTARAACAWGPTSPLETLLGREGLARLGAIMAVDGDGVLRGIVTVDRVRRALRPAWARGRRQLVRADHAHARNQAPTEREAKHRFGHPSGVALDVQVNRTRGSPRPSGPRPAAIAWNAERVPWAA